MVSAVLCLARLYVGPAPLNHDRAKQIITGQNLFGFCFVSFRDSAVAAEYDPLKFLFHFAEVSRQRMNSQRRGFEEIRLVARKELDQVLQVNQAVIDGSGGQQKHGLVLQNIVKLPIARWL